MSLFHGIVLMQCYFNGIVVTILMAFTVKNWVTITPFGVSGWMCHLRGVKKGVHNTPWGVTLGCHCTPQQCTDSTFLVFFITFKVFTTPWVHMVTPQWGVVVYLSSTFQVFFNTFRVLFGGLFMHLEGVIKLYKTELQKLQNKINNDDTILMMIQLSTSCPLYITIHLTNVFMVFAQLLTVLQESMTSAQRAINAYNLLSLSRTSSAVELDGEK